jgi:peptidyl-prolyl cis-trans isomerase C
VRRARRLRGELGALLLGAGLALAGAACTRTEPLPDPDVVARLAGEPIRNAEFETHLRTILGEQGEALASEALSQLLDQFLIERLLVRAAVDAKRVEPGADAASAADALLALEPSAPPGEDEIAAWFTRNRARLALPERVELAEIRTEERFAAERARREILAGADFAETARRVSTGPAAERGGRQGVFAREELPPAFAAVVFRLDVGGVSEVVESDSTFHLFQVLSRRPAEEPTLAGSRERAVSALEAERADRALARVVAAARSRYAVEVFDRNLPFAYRGTFPLARSHDKR